MESKPKRCNLCGQIQPLKNLAEPFGAQIVEDMRPCVVCGQNRPFPTRPGRWELYVGWPESEWRPVTVKEGPTKQLIVLDDADESKIVELEKMNISSLWRKR